MKTDIHPTYFKEAKITCSCGHVTVVGSTRESYSTELCSKCHPFYTGKQKTVDTAGMIEKFKAKQKKAEAAKADLEERSTKKKKPRKSMEQRVNEAIQESLNEESKKDEKLMKKIKKHRPQSENEEVAEEVAEAEKEIPVEETA